ncbi:MAG: hypothetical protein ACXQS2_06080 [Methermicoccaceae archaeon]
MLFQRINRSSPERVFIIVYNSYDTASLSNGQAICWDYAADADGVSVTKPPARAASAGAAFAGIAAETIAAGDYGLCQVYGYHSAVRVRNMTGGSPALAAGSPLSMAAATTFCMENYDTGSTNLQVVNCGFALEAQTSWTTKTIAAFIKAL